MLFHIIVWKFLFGKRLYPKKLLKRDFRNYGIYCGIRLELALFPLPGDLPVPAEILGRDFVEFFDNLFGIPLGFGARRIGGV